MVDGCTGPHVLEDRIDTAQYYTAVVVPGTAGTFTEVSAVEARGHNASPLTPSEVLTANTQQATARTDRTVRFSSNMLIFHLYSTRKSRSLMLYCSSRAIALYECRMCISYTSFTRLTKKVFARLGFSLGLDWDYFYSI